MLIQCIKSFIYSAHLLDKSCPQSGQARHRAGCIEVTIFIAPVQWINFNGSVSTVLLLNCSATYNNHQILIHSFLVGCNGSNKELKKAGLKSLCLALKFYKFCKSQKTNTSTLKTFTKSLSNRVKKLVLLPCTAC